MGCLARGKGEEDGREAKTQAGTDHGLVLGCVEQC
jgi:hypothetical protein